MAEEVVKIINVKTNEAINSVKELKQYINELKDDLVKTDKSSEEYRKTLEEIANAQTKLTEVQNDSKNAMNYAEGSYKALNQELVKLRNEYRNLSEEQRNSTSIGGAMLNRIQELDSQLKSIDADMGNFQRNVGHYQLALEVLNKTYANERQELRALKTALEELTPGTEEYNKAFNRAAEITHNLQEQQTLLRYSSADVGDQLSNVRGIATNMIAGFSAVNAVMGLFGDKNEDVAKAMLRVQQTIALVQGLEGMDGLLKRTQGLSTAMKKWFESSKQVTTQTVAQTTAVKADAVATQAQTTATEGATVAQKGLNAAMKANPIGVILTVVMALVTAYSLLKSRIDNLIKGNEKLQTVLGKVKGALSGVATTIKQAVLVPIKELLNYFETIGNVMLDVLTGHWGKIGQDIKQGVSDAKQIVVEAGEDISNSYNKAIDKNRQEWARKRAQDRAKELGDIIKDNDAKYDSDWKYTESGKTLYEEYLQAKINSYKKDSDEYKEAVREKMSFDRDYDKFQKKQKEEQAKKAKEAEEKRRKAAEDAKKKLETIEKNYTTQIQNQYGTSIRQTVNAYKEELKTLQDFLNVQLKVKGTDKNEIKKILGEVQNLLSEVNTIDIFNLENNASSLEDSLKKMTQLFNANLKNAIEKSGEEAKKKINDEIIKLFEATLKPSIPEKMAELQNEVDKYDIKAKFEIDTGMDFDIWKDSGLFVAIDGFNQKQRELDKVAKDSAIELEGLNIQLKHYQEIVDYVKANGMDLLPSNEYNNALSKIDELNNQIEQATVARLGREREINNRYFQLELEDAEVAYNSMAKARENAFNKENYTGDWWELLTPVSPSDEATYMEELYNTQLNGLNKIKELWEQRKNDQSITNEERIEAEKNLNQTLGQIQDLELEKEMQVAQKRAEITQMWVDGVSDAVKQIGSLIGSLADYYEADLEAKVKNKELSEKEADDQFENIKGMRIAEATINTIAGAIGAFLQASSTYPAPYGQILGGITAAAVTAAGVAQIAKINSTQRNSANNVSNPSASVPIDDYDFNPQYVTNTTGQQDTENLRNALAEQPLRAYVVESDISDAQKLQNTRKNETSF